MDTTDFEKEIEKVMEIAPKKQLPPVGSVRAWADGAKPATAQPVSLAEQWSMSVNIQRELKDRLRKEKQKILTDHDTEWLALRHRYEQRISDTIADMRAELEAEQRRMVEAYQARTRELDLLAQRVEDNG